MSRRKSERMILWWWIEEDSNDNQEEDESAQEENNSRNLLQTMRYGRTCRAWRGRARAADFLWIKSIFLLLFADKFLCTIYSLFKGSRRQEYKKCQWGLSMVFFTWWNFGFYILIVNDTNTIFYSNEKIVSKLRSYGFSQCNIRILKMLLQGRVTIFWAHIFGGAGFLTVNLRRAKILEPLLYK